MSPLKYSPGVVDNVEDLEKYIVGGFHPEHLDDTLDNGRYRIVHKPGFGVMQLFGLVKINVLISMLHSRSLPSSRRTAQN